MHEFSLIADVLRKITFVAQEHGAAKVTRATLNLGALCHLSAAHLRAHFTQAACGTVAEGADLQINTLTDIHDPHAQEITLESIEVQDDT